jgi:hypothetical protein
MLKARMFKFVCAVVCCWRPCNELALTAFEKYSQLQNSLRQIITWARIFLWKTRKLKSVAAWISIQGNAIGKQCSETSLSWPRLVPLKPGQRKKIVLKFPICDVYNDYVIPYLLVLLSASCLAYSSTLKIEATCPSKTLVDFQWTTPRYIPEGRTVHNHRCKSLKSSTRIFLIRHLRLSLKMVKFWFLSTLDHNKAYFR